MLDPSTVPGRFADHARERPDRVAIDAGGDTGPITYGELARSVDTIAGHLQDRLGAASPAVRPAVVGILTSTATPLVTASLAVARAGLVSVAIDPAYPPERRQAVAADAGVALVVTDGTCGPVEGARVVLLAELGGAEPGAVVEMAIDPDRLSSVLYTSGSTGVPKGVAFSHRARLAVADALPPATTGPDVRSCTVDVGSSGGGEGVHLAPLLCGGSLLPFPVERHGIGGLPAFLRDRHATALRTVPTLVRHLLASLPAGEGLEALEAVALFGEQLTGADVARLRLAIHPEGTIHNSYGSTETGVLTTMSFGPGTPVEPGPVPAGRPVPGRTVQIHDHDGRPVAPGVVGRVVAVGRALPTGYWGTPDRSADAFTVADDGTVTVVTGDLGHLDAGGVLHVEGREDDVVKVAGHRVALAEVEAALVLVPGVREGAVAARPDGHGVTRLTAGIVLEPGQEVSPGLVRAALARRLPRPMLPDLVVVLDELPRLPGGKVDRSALPDRAPSTPTPGGRRTADDLPGLVRAAFAEALEVPAHEIDDEADFFDELGGDSLRAVQVLLLVEEGVGGIVAPEVLLEAPTVASLAVALASGRARDVSPVVPVRAEGDGPPLFVLPGAGGQLWGARRLADRLPPDVPVYAIQPPEVRGDQGPSSVAALAAAYVSAVRAVDPSGPHLLFGFSTGGVVALEMARQLDEAGSPVGLVVLGDTMPPGVRLAPPPSLGRPRSLRPGQIPSAVRRDLSLGAARVRDRLRGSPSGAPTDGHATPSRTAAADRQRRATRAGADLVDRHVDVAYRGPVVLLRCEHTPVRIEAEWAARVGDLTVHRFAGRHNDMLSEPVLSDVAATLAAEIAASVGRVASPRS